jgi:hypothetical protein
MILPPATRPRTARRRHIAFLAAWTVCIPLALGAHRAAAAAPMLGFTEEFAPADTTAGFLSGAQISNPGTGGRGGSGDGFLRIARTPFPGQFGAFNSGPAYAGNYIAAGVTKIDFWLCDVESNENFSIHLGIGSTVNFWQCNTGFAPPEGSWARFSVDLRDSTNFTQIIATPNTSYTLALTNADRLLWRHDLPPFIMSPDPIMGQMGLDGILFTNFSGAIVSPGEVAAAGALRLSPAHPNPTLGPTSLSAELAASGSTRVLVVSAAGRIIRELFQGELPAGRHAFAWDGRTAGTGPATSGVYFIRVETAARSESARVTVVR